VASERLVRWRLVLGEAADAATGAGLSADELAADAALAWLYDRPTEGEADRDLRGARGGGERSVMSVPRWISEVHRLFPKETVERLERDAVLTYQIHEVVTNPEVLARVEPSTGLLQAVLHTKHLMNPEVLAMARELVAKVIRALIERLSITVRQARHGNRVRRRARQSSARDFDARGTIRRNLDGWDPQHRRLVIRRPLFTSRSHRTLETWQMILLVDESGSMLGSVIHSAVTAACLWGLPGLKTHLCIFDTEVVDLTDKITDPVEVLMKVQLGGGTDIAKAVAYGAGLVENPRRTIVAIISDFFEGGSHTLLERHVKMLVEQGVHVLGLAALDEQANPSYDRDMARRLVEVGAHVGAMTPGELVAFVAEKVRR
jgi:Mg-chelatase subunit ChlD